MSARRVPPRYQQSDQSLPYFLRLFGGILENGIVCPIAAQSVSHIDQVINTGKFSRRCPSPACWIPESGSQAERSWHRSHPFRADDFLMARIFRKQKAVRPLICVAHSAAVHMKSNIISGIILKLECKNRYMKLHSLSL